MTNIEWTDKTWNPVTGCTKVSPGCKNCYAEGIADRFFAKQYPPNADGSLRKFTDVRCHPERLNEPLRWKKPCMVFVNSMSDLFHEDVPFEFIEQVWQVISQRMDHTFQILTKRPARMLEFARWISGADDISVAEWPRNTWLGVSVENQKQADERIPILLQVPAAVRFISAEPLLESIRLTRHHQLCPEHDFPGGFCTQWHPGVRSIDWLICGGESGPGARPFQLDWGLSLLEQCQADRIPFFMKQIGSRPTAYSGVMQSIVTWPSKDRKGGDMLEWHPFLRVREFPQIRAVGA